MNDAGKKEGRNVEIYNYGSDFQILTPKEKRRILKNAKQLLNLQKENTDMVIDWKVKNDFK
jgi:hypothetical protein